MVDKAKLQNTFLVVLLAGVITLAFLLVSPYLNALLLGAALAIIFYPLYQKLLIKNQKTIAAIVTIVLVTILILTPLLFFGFQLFQESRTLYLQLTTEEPGFQELDIAIQQAENQIQQIAPGFQLDIHQYTRAFLGWITQNVSSIFTTVTEFFFTVFLSLLAFYYFLKDGGKLRQKIIALSPLSDTYDEKIFAQLQSTVHSVIKGALVIALLQGVLTGVGFMIFGVPNATLWGSVAAIVSLIPTLGAVLVTLAGAAYLAATNQLIFGIGLLIWGIATVGIVDDIVRPHVIERGIAIHPFLILLSVIGGIHVFGIIGFLLGPLVLSFFMAILEVYQSEFLKAETKPAE